MCGLFISVYDSKIFLIHQNAREFLLSSHAPSSREWKESLNMSSADGTISHICLHYLNLQDCTSSPQEQLDQDEDNQSIGQEYPFLDQTAKEWPVHYTSQDTELARSSRKAGGMLSRISQSQISYWSPIYCKWRYLDFPDHWTELEIASQLGLSYVVEDLLNEGANVTVGGAKTQGTR